MARNRVSIFDEHTDKIIELLGKGYSYSQICEELGEGYEYNALVYFVNARELIDYKRKLTCDGCKHMKEVERYANSSKICICTKSWKMLSAVYKVAPKFCQGKEIEQ